MYSPKGTRIEGQAFDRSVVSLPTLDDSPQLSLNVEDVNDTAVRQSTCQPMEREERKKL